jgi:hypothetical protein
VLGAVFAARAGRHADPAAIADAVQTVFLVAAPISALALLVVLLLEEIPLATAGSR